MRREIHLCDKCGREAGDLQDLTVGDQRLGEICGACKVSLLPANLAAMPRNGTSKTPGSSMSVKDAIQQAASIRPTFTASDVAQVMGTSTYQANHRLGHYISTGQVIRVDRGQYRLPTAQELEAARKKTAARA